MKEIPMPLIRANQVGIVLSVAIALVIQQPLVIDLLWLIQLIPFATTSKANLFVAAATPFLRSRLKNSDTQAAELTRFNNGIAVVLLTISALFFALGWNASAYLTASIVALAASAALAGYCIGCTVYFQYKSWKRRIVKVDRR